MLRVLFCLLISMDIFAFSLTVNTGKDDNLDYYLIHLQGNEISCKILDPNDAVRSYSCMVLENLNSNLADQNLDFANIRFTKLSNGYEINITPKLPSFIFDSSLSLSTQTDIRPSNLYKSNHITIAIGSLNLYSQISPNGLDFSVDYPYFTNPGIGALDLNKEPIIYEGSNDVSTYLGIKQYFETNDFADALKDAKKTLQIHPNSIFASEIWLYYLKSLHELSKQSKDYKKSEQLSNELISSAKQWMKNYASDKNYSEVLYLLTYAYLNRDQRSDAEYTMDILMTEHPESVWTKRSILSYADEMLKNGFIDEASRLYEDVLYSTNDIDIASRATFGLTNASLSRQKFNEAKKYLDKIINANSKYLNKDNKQTLEIASDFRQKNMYDIAAKLDKIVLDSINKKSNEYEPVLRHLGLDLARTNDKKEAYIYLKRYQAEFPNNEFSSQISENIDRLFFEVNDKTDEQRHKYYAQLIEKYKGMDIADKALVEELKMNFKEKKYPQILSYLNYVKETNNTQAMAILKDSAVIVANMANQTGNCIDTVSIVDTYQIESEISDKFKFFDCYMRTSRYEDGLNLAMKNVKTDDLYNRVEWLSNISNALFKLRRYEECIKACDDALSLAAKVKYSDPTWAIFYRFYSLIKLNRFEEATDSIKALEDFRGTDNRLVEVYYTAAKFASAQGLNSAALTYAKKAIDMQKKLKITTFWPEINFIYINALLKINNNSEAILESTNLLSSNLQPQDRIRALYQIAEIYIGQNNYSEAGAYVKDCLDMQLDSPWKNLCLQQDRLLQK